MWESTEEASAEGAKWHKDGRRCCEDSDAVPSVAKVAENRATSTAGRAYEALVLNATSADVSVQLEKKTRKNGIQPEKEEWRANTTI